MFVQVDVTMQVSLMAAKKGTTTAFNTHTTTTSTTTSSSSSVLPVVPSMDRLPIMTMTGAGAGLQSTMEAYDHSNLNVTFVCQAVHR